VRERERQRWKAMWIVPHSVHLNVSKATIVTAIPFFAYVNSETDKILLLLLLLLVVVGVVEVDVEVTAAVV